MTADNRPPVPWPRISVVIPTLNEARNMPHLLKTLPCGIHEIIVADGHSVDGTLAAVRKVRPEARIVMQTRRGKGNALACGCQAATGDIIALLDADGPAGAAQIPDFVAALLGGADFAKGTRFAAGGANAGITRLRRLGNRMLAGIANLLFGARYTDLCYGPIVLWRRHLSAVGFDSGSAGPADSARRHWGDGLEIETLIPIRAAAANLTAAEIPGSGHAAIHRASHLSAAGGGLRVLHAILRERFAPSRHASSSPVPAGPAPAAAGTCSPAGPVRRPGPALKALIPRQAQPRSARRRAHSAPPATGNRP